MSCITLGLASWAKLIIAHDDRGILEFLKYKHDHSLNCNVIDGDRSG